MTVVELAACRHVRCKDFEFFTRCLVVQILICKDVLGNRARCGLSQYLTQMSLRTHPFRIIEVDGALGVVNSNP